MAQIWSEAVTNRVFQVEDLNVLQSPPPATFNETLEFDSATNAVLVNDLVNTVDSATWTLLTGVIRKNGVIQVRNPDSPAYIQNKADQQDRTDFSANMANHLATLESIAAAPSFTNAQRDTALRNLAQGIRQDLRRLAVLIRTRS